MTSVNSNILQDFYDDKNELEKFRELALRYADIAKQEGIRIIPFNSPEMPLFQKATIEERKIASESLETIVNIHEETIAAGERAISTRKLIWRALSKYSLVPGPDIFEHFKDEDVVIIYQENQRILFWNLQFFRFTSLTIEQIFFSVWHQMTKRSPEIQVRLQKMAEDLVTGKITGNFVPPVPGHEVEEVDTLECIRTWMELPFGSVLTRKGNLAGILIVQKMKILE